MNRKLAIRSKVTSRTKWKIFRLNQCWYCSYSRVSFGTYFIYYLCKQHWWRLILQNVADNTKITNIVASEAQCQFMHFSGLVRKWQINLKYDKCHVLYVRNHNLLYITQKMFHSKVLIKKRPWHYNFKRSRNRATSVLEWKNCKYIDWLVSLEELSISNQKKWYII